MPDWSDILGLKPPARVSTVRAASLTTEPVSDTSSRKNMILLIQLRWLAVAGQVVTIAVVQLGMGIPLPLPEMSIVLVALVVLNLSSLKWLGSRPEVDDRGLFIALVLDVVALTVQLYFSGGAANPFIFLYLLQVTLAAVLLNARSTWAIGLLACACFAGLATINRPLVLASGGSDDLFRLHIAGTLVAFALDVGLLVVFVTRITGNLRERDAYLAAYRQHAIEEDHIVRMGLLASGAAFNRAETQPTIRQVYEIAELGLQPGEPTRSPAYLQFTVVPEQPVIPGEALDFRDEIMSQMYDRGDPQPKRTLAFRVETTDEGKTLGNPLKERREFNNWRTVGTLTFNAAVASYNGDHVLHFHHPRWREDRNDPSTVHEGK